MDFQLQYLESALPEQWLLRGEELLEGGAVQHLIEVEKHLWSIGVGRHEVEIQITPKRVKAYTCDCDTYRRENSCAHIAAGLLALRRHLTTQREAATKASTPADSSPKRLTTPAILSNVSREELVNFVRDYARSNRNFNIALKARFAGSVPMADEKEKYYQLLDSTLKAARNKNDQFSFRGSQKIIKVIRELRQQVDTLLAEEHWSEAAAVITAVLHKVGPIVRKAPDMRDKLEQEMLNYGEQLAALLQADLAPQLLDSLWEFLYEEIQKSTIQSTRLLNKYFNQIIQLTDIQLRKDKLLVITDDQIQRRSSGNERQQWLIFKLQLLQTWDAREAIQQYIVQHLDEPTFLLFAVRDAMQRDHYKKAAYLAEQGLLQITDEKVLHQLRVHLLDSGIQLNDRERICSQAEQLFINTQETRYFELIKAHCEGDWREKSMDLLNRLEKQPYSIRKRDAIARVLAETGQTEELLAYITRLQSLDLLLEFDAALLPELQTSVDQLYHQLIESYLQQHFGRKPSEKIRLVIQHLFESGQTALAEELVRKIRARYTERHSLLEELAIFPH